MRATFGEFVLDIDSRILLRNGARVHLSGKAFQLLELLLRNRPRALSKAELMESLWPGVYVLESSLAGAVAEIREALGQSGSRSGVVRTVHGFGYAFDAEIEEERRQILCHLLWPDGQAALEAGVFDVGRDPSAPILIENGTVTWRHARIRVSGSSAAPSVSVEDLGSSNGTFVNDVPVSGPIDLMDGAALRLGSVVLRVRLAGSMRKRTDPLE
ncbi:MAG: winged helix-turn-helix domain-containing protein [Vicinamibacteria bacterium]|nr:winged helix-turn-helix domain-containing protein [Vicinamibacteria bacterium]